MSVEEFREYVEKMYRVSDWKDELTVKEYVEYGHFALEAFDDMMRACPPYDLDDIRNLCNYLDEKIDDYLKMAPN